MHPQPCVATRLAAVLLVSMPILCGGLSAAEIDPPPDWTPPAWAAAPDTAPLPPPPAPSLFPADPTFPGDATWQDDTPPSTLRGYGRWLWSDTAATFTAPFRWDRSDFARFALTAAGIGGSMLWLDHPVDRFNRTSGRRGEHRFWKGVSDANGPAAYGILGGFFVVGYGFGVDRAKLVWLEALEAGGLAGGILCPALKWAVGRHRPDVGSHADRFDPFGGSQSFPSGHTTQAFALATTLAAAYPDKPWIGGLALTGAAAVGYSRLYLHKHFLSDVLAGAALGSAVGWEIVHLHRYPATAQHPMVPTAAALAAAEADESETTGGLAPADVELLADGGTEELLIAWKM